MNINKQEFVNELKKLFVTTFIQSKTEVKNELDKIISFYEQGREAELCNGMKALFPGVTPKKDLSKYQSSSKRLLDLDKYLITFYADERYREECSRIKFKFYFKTKKKKEKKGTKARDCRLFAENNIYYSDPQGAEVVNDRLSSELIQLETVTKQLLKGLHQPAAVNDRLSAELHKLETVTKQLITELHQPAAVNDRLSAELIKLETVTKQLLTELHQPTVVNDRLSAELHKLEIVTDQLLKELHQPRAVTDRVLLAQHEHKRWRYNPVYFRKDVNSTMVLILLLTLIASCGIVFAGWQRQSNVAMLIGFISLLLCGIGVPIIKAHYLLPNDKFAAFFLGKNFFRIVDQDLILGSYAGTCPDCNCNSKMELVVDGLKLWFTKNCYYARCEKFPLEHKILFNQIYIK